MSQTFEATLSCTNNLSVIGTSRKMLRGDGRRLVFSHTVLDQFVIKNVREEFGKRNFWSVNKRTQSNTTFICC